jgi:hypothetical protein
VIKKHRERGGHSPRWAAEPEMMMMMMMMMIIIIIMFLKMNNFAGRQKINSFPVKTEGDSYSFDIANSEYDKQISLSHTTVMGERLKFKN